MRIVVARWMSPSDLVACQASARWPLDSSKGACDISLLCQEYLLLGNKQDLARLIRSHFNSAIKNQLAIRAIKIN